MHHINRPDAGRRRVRGPQAFAAGLAALALAALALAASADLDAGTIARFGPGMLPRALAFGIGALGLVLVVAGLVRPGHLLERPSIRGPLFVLLAVLAFALTIRTAGLAIAAPLAVVLGGLASRESRPVELIVFAALLTAAAIGVFRYALGLPIPVFVLFGFHV